MENPGVPLGGLAHKLCQERRGIRINMRELFRRDDGSGARFTSELLFPTFYCIMYTYLEAYLYAFVQLGKNPWI